MSRAAAATSLGLVFLLVGLALIGVAVLPVVPAPHTAHVALTPLFIGVAFSIFGALLIPSSGAQTALTVIVTTAAPYIPRFGGQRAGDPPKDGTP